jgi:probable rRNA maturation factor
MIDLQVNPDYLTSAPEDLLARAAQAALSHQSAPAEADLTIVITGDAEIQELNRQYMEIDAPTDVLSFPAGELNPETGHTYLGDIVISFPRALTQAQQGGHPAAQELQLLVVHGVLHLLGYDHADPAGKASMWAAQADVLRCLDNPLTDPG